MTEVEDAKAAEAARDEMQLAQVAMERDPREARNHLVEARRLNPRDSDIAMSLARLEVRLGLFRDAGDSLRKVLALCRESEEALALSALCGLRLGHIEQAEAMAQRALAQGPGNRIALEVRADCRRAEGRWTEVEREYRALLAGLEGPYGAAHARLSFKLAQCLSRLGAHSGAWELTEDLIARGFAGPAVRALNRDCDRMHRREVGRAFRSSGLLGRFQLWLAQGQIARAVSLGLRRKGGGGGDKAPDVSGGEGENPA